MIKKIGNHWALAACIVLIGILFSLPAFVKNTYLFNVAIFILIYSISSVGLLIIMRVGEISFAQAGFMAIGAYVSALLTTKLQLSFWASLPIACLSTVIVALILGCVAVRTKHVHFFVVTLALGETIRLFLLSWNSELLGGPSGIFGIPAPNTIRLGEIVLGFETREAIYQLTLIILCAVSLVSWRIDRSYIGKAWDAIAQDDNLAAAIGINVYRQRLLSFIIGSAIAGLGGVLYAHTMTYISPYDFSFFFSVELLIFIIIGGSASFAGPIVGAVVLNFISEALREIGQWELVAYGLLLIFALRFMPNGITGWLNRALIACKEASISIDK